MNTNIHFKLSYDGHVVYRWYGVPAPTDALKRQMRGSPGYTDLRVQVARPHNPETFNVGVWPNQISACGTVSLEFCPSDGLPPQDALDALRAEIRQGYMEHLEHANRTGYSAEPLPIELRPVRFDMERCAFVDADGQDAYQGKEL